MAGLSHTPDETTLRDILLREFWQSKRLKYDLEIYDRAREGSEQHTYKFLTINPKPLPLLRERKRKNRERIARSHVDKYGADASPRAEPLNALPRSSIADWELSPYREPNRASLIFFLKGYWALLGFFVRVIV